ncbi:CRISPR-associated protein Cas4 [Dehalococcoides mccartyi]|uniref:CRISPR-associated exonuclease Cas4 n=1 Tax=Dehalococcoides mccartyi TaxID=61435 RepID=A0A0V8M5C8_9CHLR|nr:CRISPR-associated protein Cas4 [Dehalococcoides mccartyi]KSV18990.1 CRISPR-associated protein Cas4 [Dehalococcoides mccartyi]
MVYSEEELVPISALQHLAFCPRQAGLICLDEQWQDNQLTFEGNELHKSTHQPQSHKRKQIMTSRSLSLRSLQLGLIGMADTVEFHPRSKAEGGVRIASCGGHYFPHIVEYKRGKAKPGNCDLIQICAQAICLEEMLDIKMNEAEIFYGQTRRRHKVMLCAELRNETARLAHQMHQILNSGIVPHAKYKPSCKQCSLFDICAPQINQLGSAQKYFKVNLAEVLGETPA